MYTITDPSVDQVPALNNTPKQSGGGLGGELCKYQFDWSGKWWKSYHCNKQTNKQTCIPFSFREHKDLLKKSYFKYVLNIEKQQNAFMWNHSRLATCFFLHDRRKV